MTQSELLENLDGPILFQPKAEKDKMKGQVICYSGENYLTDIPTRDDLVTENNEGLMAILEDALSKHQDIPFMAIDVEESTKFTNSQAWYVLRLYSPLINGQKAAVSIIGIQVFFDILIPDKESTDAFEAKIRGILFNAIKSFKIEHIKAFSFHGYHVEKKLYLCIYTVNTKQKKMAMKAVQKKKYITASDDQFTYYRKMACEYGISLSGWSTINEIDTKALAYAQKREGRCLAKVSPNTYLWACKKKHQ
ncbi:14120_t:CDS:2 [Dentiscutata erythropus]|uniref:14120_t:CDS:1 n=1 Tax=Dentiscutata erythropus TaxID=1348616 RepID=A0A9N9BHJ8_9GLOM|nr:14120_t:CDS:2 [Dentiscutata erythropus]